MPYKPPIAPACHTSTECITGSMQLFVTGHQLIGYPGFHNSLAWRRTASDNSHELTVYPDFDILPSQALLQAAVEMQRRWFKDAARIR